MVDPNCFVFAQSVVCAILEQQWVSVSSFLSEANCDIAGFPRCCVLRLQLECNCCTSVISPPWLPQWQLYSSPTCSFISRHFSEFLRSHHYCKYQIEVLTSGSVFLADILFCESALFYFSEVSGPGVSQDIVYPRYPRANTFLQQCY